MGTRLWAETYTNTELANGAFSQMFRANESRTIVKYIKTWVILAGSPSFTGLTAYIYSNSGTSPNQLLYTSTNSWTSTQLLNGYSNAVKEIYFTFNEVKLAYNTYYHIVLKATASNLIGNTYFGWKYAVNDNSYQPLATINNINTDFKKVGFDFSIIGANEWHL